jgi:hypothetical protein
MKIINYGGSADQLVDYLLIFLEKKTVPGNLEVRWFIFNKILGKANVGFDDYRFVKSGCQDTAHGCTFSGTVRT